MPSPPRTNDPTGIAQRILVLRGQRVLLDADLALLYGVSPKRLNEQVKRNRAQFPEDFLFQLEINELRAPRSQSATLDKGRGRHRKYAPTAYTEYGAIMAATVLSSPRAVEMFVYVVRNLGCQDAPAVRRGLRGDTGADGNAYNQVATDWFYGGSGQEPLSGAH